MALDLVVIGILLVSAIVAFLRGFVREIFTIGSLLGAAAATFAFGPQLKPMVHGWIIDPGAEAPQQLFGIVPYEMLVPVIAFAIVFTVTIIVLTIVTHIISKGVHSVGLGPVDRSLGVVFGLLRGVILVGLMGLVFNFVLSDEQRDTYFGQSKTYPMVVYTADLMQALMPGREVLDHITKKKAHGAALTATDQGNGPLEPGQSAQAKESLSGGYTAFQRKAVEALIGTAGPDKSPRKKFNE
jgi:membrane protein required for colicin V production